MSPREDIAEGLILPRTPLKPTPHRYPDASLTFWIGLTAYAAKRHGPGLPWRLVRYDQRDLSGVAIFQEFNTQRQADAALVQWAAIVAARVPI